MFEVTVTVVVDAEDLDSAKAVALQYFHELEEVRDNEIREMK